MSLIWICLIKCTNESCYTSEYVILHSWISVAHTNTSCVTCACIMARIRGCHITHVNASCHTCECVMARIWMCHVTHVNASCHTCECVMSHMFMRHATHVNASCHKCLCVVLFECVTWLILICDMAFSICETWLIYSFMHRVTHTQRVTSRMWTRHATQITRKNHFTHMNATYTYEWVMSHTQTRDVTHTNESRDTHEQVTSHLTRDSALQTFSTPQISTILMHALATVAEFQNFCTITRHSAKRARGT